jgi:hypothetical protein
MIERFTWGGGKRRPKIGETVYLGVERALPIPGEKAGSVVGIVGRENLGIIVRVGRGTVDVKRWPPRARLVPDPR